MTVSPVSVNQINKYIKIIKVAVQLKIIKNKNNKIGT